MKELVLKSMNIFSKKSFLLRLTSLSASLLCTHCGLNLSSHNAALNASPSRTSPGTGPASERMQLVSCPPEDAPFFGFISAGHESVTEADVYSPDDSATITSTKTVVRWVFATHIVSFDGGRDSLGESYVIRKENSSPDHKDPQSARLHYNWGDIQTKPEEYPEVSGAKAVLHKPYVNLDTSLVGDFQIKTINGLGRCLITFDFSLDQNGLVGQGPGTGEIQGENPSSQDSGIIVE